MSALTERIAQDLDVIGAAIVKNDAEVIEAAAVRVSTMLAELRRELLSNDRSAKHDVSPIAAAAKRCSVLLRRARLSLAVLQNLHDLFSADHAYHVRG